jgi:hypothetical protein
MKVFKLRNNLINTAAVIGVVLFSAMPTLASAHSLIFDTDQYDDAELTLNLQQCEALLGNLEAEEGVGAIEQGVKRGTRGAVAGAAAGAISGNSGSSAAKKGAALGTSVGLLSGKSSQKSAKSTNQKQRDSLMRNCMSGRGYQSLN